jgi:hypothetical protein
MWGELFLESVQFHPGALCPFSQIAEKPISVIPENLFPTISPSPGTEWLK